MYTQAEKQILAAIRILNKCLLAYIRIPRTKQNAYVRCVINTQLKNLSYWSETTLVPDMKKFPE